MMSTIEGSALRGSVRALAGHGLVPGLADALAADADDIARALEAAIIEAVPAYSATANPDVLPELRDHLDSQIEAILGLLRGAWPESFDFVRAHAERRALQRFPLEALLHGYRAAHKLLANRIRDAALAQADTGAQVRRVVAAVADFAIEYFDAVSTVATSAYVEHTRALAEAEGDRRTELLDTLLGGYDESDSRAAQLLRRAGYLEQRQSYCVIHARSVDAREMASPARAQRMADAMSQALRDAPVRVLSGVREGSVVAIVSGTRRLSGWTAPQSLLADRIYPSLRKVGPAALIGMSNDVPSTSHIPRAAREARLALDFATVSDRVMAYARIPLRRMLVAHARDSMQPALPAWLDAFLETDQRARGALSRTLRAYADADMNVQKAAQALGVHPNTIYARVQRIVDATGLSPLSYHGLTEMLIALDCRR